MLVHLDGQESDTLSHHVLVMQQGICPRQSRHVWRGLFCWFLGLDNGNHGVEMGSQEIDKV